MAGKPIRHLRPAELIRRSHQEDRHERRVSNWIVPWDFREQIDAGLIACSYGRSASLSVGADQAMNAVRLAFARFTTYDPYHDVDISFLKVRDLGDIPAHASGVVESHRHIEQAIGDILESGKLRTLISIGGDHSVTAPIIRAIAKASPGGRGGLVYFDAHIDATELADGYPTNAPLRSILEESLVAGKNTMHIGVSGFANALYYKRWLEDRGVTMVSSREVQSRGIEDVLRQAQQVAGVGTDWVYLSVDIDVCGQEHVPGTGAAYPGGLEPSVVLRAVEAMGQWSEVIAMDLVEVSPPLDMGQQTTKLAASLILHFLLGVALREENEEKRREMWFEMARLGDGPGGAGVSSTPSLRGQSPS